MSPVEEVDKRRQRGMQSRRVVLRLAVDTASLKGLDGVSFGGLAAGTGMSKAGIQALFRSREALELATVEFAREMFIDAVILPVRHVPHGAARMRALLEQWLVYAQTPLFAGGCFRAANLAEFDSRPGLIRDALFRDQQEWIGTLTRELQDGVNAGEIAELDVELAAFQIDAVLCAANTAFRWGDDGAADKVRRTVESFLVPPAK